MKNIYAVVATLSIIALAILVAFDRSELTRLHDEISLLKSAIQDLRNVSEQPKVPIAIQRDVNELAHSRSKNTELMQLRGEVGLLKREVDALKNAPELLKAKRVEEDYNQIKTLYDHLMSLPRAELRKALPTEYPSEQVARYEADLLKVEQQYSRAYIDLGPQHPETLRLSELKGTIEQQIDTAIDEALQLLEVSVSKGIQIRQ
jgi:hypothetical protein